MDTDAFNAKRLAAGFYYLEEVAKLLAQQQGIPKGREDIFLKPLEAAATQGLLRVRDNCTHLFILPGQRMSLYSCVVTVADVNAWLEDQTAPYRWEPVGTQSTDEKPETPAPAAAAASQTEAPSVLSNACEPDLPTDNRGSKKRWTETELAELAAYRETHGTKKAAEKFEISGQRVRALLPTKKPAHKGSSVFNYRPKQ